MSKHEQTDRDEDDEPLPPLPLDRDLSFRPQRWWVFLIIALVGLAFRLLMHFVNDVRAAERRPDTTMVIEDPGAGLSPEEREALDEALRRGRPLSLDSEGHLRPAP